MSWVNRRRPWTTWTSPAFTVSPGPAPVMSRPANCTCPVRGSRPEMARSNVVLPAPFGPSSATASPAPMVSATSRNTTILPYPAERPATSSNGSCREDSGAEVGTHHLPMRTDLLRRPRRQHLAEIEHGHAIADVEDQVGMVLDQQHRGAGAADPLDQRA